MKAKWILVMTLTACFSACGRPASRNSSRKSGAAMPQTGAVAEEIGDGLDDDPARQELYLPDDSVFLPALEPWPPHEGPATLKAKADTDDGEQKFAGTVRYRIAPTEQNSTEWLDMPRAGEDDEFVYFEVPVTLTKGTSFIQFRVQDAGDPQPTELLDWKIELK